MLHRGGAFTGQGGPEPGGRKVRLLVLLFVAVITIGITTGITTGTATGETIVVSPDGPLTIQAAIYLTWDGDIVELTDGIYTGDGNRDLTFFGRAITVRSQSGDPTSCIIDCEGSDAENHRGFIFENVEGLDSVVEGLTITGGYDDWSGGIYCPSGDPTISNCRFIGNTGSEGGGLCVWGPAEIIGCWFEGNHSTGCGGGVSACCMFGPTATFIECTFVANTAGMYGGAFRC